MFEDTTTGRVQGYVRIRPLVQSDVRSLDGKGAVSVEDDDFTQVRMLMKNCDNIIRNKQDIETESISFTLSSFRETKLLLKTIAADRH